MGEAKRRIKLGLPPKNSKRVKASNFDSSPKLVEWLLITQNQKDYFIKMSIRGSWIGIVLLVLLWIVVRFIGPTAGWWTPADTL